MLPRRAWGLALACALALPVWVVLGAHVLAALPPEGAESLAGDALVTAGALALLAVSGAALAREPLASRLGLGPSRIGTGAVAFGALGLLALSHALEGALSVAQLDTSPALARFADAVSGLGPRALLLPLVSFAGVAATAEELMFRGLLQRGLEPAIGVLPAVGLAALAFGAAHADFVQGAAALVLGIYLGLLAHAADSIRVSIAAHALNNAAAVLEAATGFAPPAEGPGAWLSIAAGLALAGVALRTTWRAARRQPAAGGPPQAEAHDPGRG